jgi:hypothetical protein
MLRTFLLTLGLLCCVPAMSAAQAQCTTATLQGQFVFTGRGFIEAAEPGIQRVHYGIFVFDGAGKLTGKHHPARAARSAAKLEGAYNLDADCTGTMEFGTVPNHGGQTHWDLYVTEDHKRGHIIRMDDGSMAVRSFEK